jgi:hypothetical protein
LLAGLGCEYGQGFLYSRPVEAEAALGMAHDGHLGDPVVTLDGDAARGDEGARYGT